MIVNFFLAKLISRVSSDLFAALQFRRMYFYQFMFFEFVLFSGFFRFAAQKKDVQASFQKLTERS